MEAEEALKVLRAQYHDFLNNLQIISGLIELGRLEKARDYVRRAADEFIARGKVAKMGLPSLAWALIQLQAEGVAAGVRVTCNLEQAGGPVGVHAKDPSQPAAAPAGHWETGLGELHKEMIARASGNGKDKFLHITGKNVPEGYVMAYSGDFAWADIIAAVAGSAAAYGIELTLSGEKKVEVFLKL